MSDPTPTPTPREVLARHLSAAVNLGRTRYAGDGEVTVMPESTDVARLERDYLAALAALATPTEEGR